MANCGARGQGKKRVATIAPPPYIDRGEEGQELGAAIPSMVSSVMAMDWMEKGHYTL
jgi:hypothetical protein